MAKDSKVALLCAYTLASAQRYDEAESLILSDPEVAKTAEAIDLLARIRVEQGDRAEARRLWQEIREVYPEYTPAREALKGLEKAPPRFSCRTLWWGSIIATFFVGLFIGGCCLGLNPRSKSVKVRWEKMATSEDIEALRVYQGKVKRVMISSSFFDQAKNINQRGVLKEFLASALGLPGHAVLVGAPTSETPGDAIDLELQF